MSAPALILTSLLLGAFVAEGGAYAVLFTLGKILRDERLARAAPYAYAGQVLLTGAVLVFTPLDWWWKMLIAASCALYYFVPPGVWRYLIHLHGSAEEEAG